MCIGKVDFGGVTRDVSLACVPEAGVEDIVIVQAGFAISQVDEAEAQETLGPLVASGVLEEEQRFA